MGGCLTNLATLKRDRSKTHKMGSGLSTENPGGVSPDPINPLMGVGVGTLVREIGMAMIPVHNSYESMLQIVETVVKLRQFNEAPYNGHMIMLIALLRNSQIPTPITQPSVEFRRDDVDIQGVNDGVDNWTEADIRAQELLEKDRLFATYAINIYLASWKFTNIDIGTCMGVEPEDVIFSWFKDDWEEHCPKFMILVDHAQASVVLIIRGTFCFKDVVLDVVCEDAEFLDGFAHKGFLEGSRKVLDKCRRILETTLVDNFGYQLVVCGHSMGGSIAVMITLELLRTNRYPILPPGISVQCVALCPAPVYRTEGDVSLEYLEKIHIYILDKDVVPRLSLGSVAKLLAMLREVDGLRLSLDEQLGIIMWRTDEGTKLNRARVIRAVKEVRQDKFLYLHHPGQVVTLTTRDRQVEVKGMDEEKARDIASNIHIHETMISDHIHIPYRDAFSKRVFVPRV